MSTVSELRRNPKRWDEILITGDGATLTKRQIFSYYENPRVKKGIVKEVGHNPVLIRLSYEPDTVVLKRHMPGNVNKFIRFLTTGADVNDPEDYSYYTHRRMSEVHEVFGPKTDKYVIDIDPGRRVSDKTKKIYTGAIARLIGVQPEVKRVRVRYSAGPREGFYVEGFLDKSMDILTAKYKLNALLEPLTKMNGELTLRKHPREDQIRLDLTPFHELGSVKALYSLDARTGYASVPVSDLETFDKKKDARPEQVLGGRIPEQLIKRS